MTKTWCEHISYTGNLGPYEENWTYGKGNTIIMIHKSEMFCRVCGAKRPAEPEKKCSICNREKKLNLIGNWGTDFDWYIPCKCQDQEKEKKKLRERLRTLAKAVGLNGDRAETHYELSEQDWTRLSAEAIRAVEEVYKEWYFKKERDLPNWIDYLKRELLGEER